MAIETLQYTTPFLAGAVGGAMCCLLFFYVVFLKIQRVTDRIIRKKALKHRELEAVVKAAAEVPSMKVETLCRVVRFDNNVLDDAIHCRAVFYGTTIFLYAIDELVTLPDRRQEVRQEHLLGKINTSCVSVDSRRISKYHRHTNAAQRRAPVKGRCTILTAEEGMPLFLEDPALRLKERLEETQEERRLLIQQLRRRVQAASRGEESELTKGPVNIETVHRTLLEERQRQQLQQLQGRVADAGLGARSPPPPQQQDGTVSHGLLSWADGHEGGADGDAATDTESTSRSSFDLSASDDEAGSGTSASGEAEEPAVGWTPWLRSLFGGVRQRVGGGGGGARSRLAQWSRRRREKSLTPAERLTAMERSLHEWGVIAIKFPTRRENERWLTLLQRTQQTLEWRDFVAHLPNHDVLNLVLARLFFEGTRTSALQDLLMKKVRKNLVKTSRNLKQNLKGDIYLDALVIGGEVPLFSNVSEAAVGQNGELEFDFDILYRGGLGMSIRFAVTFRGIRVPDIIFHIKVLELAGRMRFNVGPPPTRKFWLGTPRPPSLRMEFTQEMAQHEGFLNVVMNILPDLSEIMTRVVKELLFEDMVLPSLDDFPWPVVGADDDATPSNTDTDTASDESDSGDDGDVAEALGGERVDGEASKSEKKKGRSKTKKREKEEKEERANGERGSTQDGKASESRATAATPRPDCVSMRTDMQRPSPGRTGAGDSPDPSRPSQGRVVVGAEHVLLNGDGATITQLPRHGPSAGAAASTRPGTAQRSVNVDVDVDGDDACSLATAASDVGTAPLTVDRLRAVAAGGGTGDSAGRLPPRPAATLAALPTGGGTPVQRAVRRMAHEDDVYSTFRPAEVQYYSTGGSEVRRGSGATFKSRGSMAVTSASTSRNDSACAATPLPSTSTRATTAKKK